LISNTLIKLLQNEKLSSSIYRLLLSLKNNGAQTFKWLNHAESLFNDSGLGYIFDSHDSSAISIGIFRLHVRSFVIHILLFSESLVK
jgi:hypothetical protein